MARKVNRSSLINNENSLVYILFPRMMMHIVVSSYKMIHIKSHLRSNVSKYCNRFSGLLVSYSFYKSCHLFILLTTTRYVQSIQTSLNASIFWRCWGALMFHYSENVTFALFSNSTVVLYLPSV